MQRYYRSQVDFKKYQGGAIKKTGGLFSFFKRKKNNNPEGINHFEKQTSGNPWRQEPKKNWKNIAALSASLLFILSWVGLMLFLPYFQINKVIISGQKITDPTAVESFVYEEYLNKNSNYFLTHKNKIEEGTREKFGLESVNVKKIFPHELAINITEKMCSVIVFDGEGYHLLDKNGGYITRILNDIKTIQMPDEENMAFSTSSPDFSSTTIFSTSTQLAVESPTTNDKPDINLVRQNSFDQPVILIKDFSPDNPNEVLEAATIQKIIDWQNLFQSKNTEEIKYYTVEKDGSGVKVFIDRNWYIIFNPERDLAAQIDNLKSILSEFKPTEYVDLRFGEKIYWK